MKKFLPMALLALLCSCGAMRDITDGIQKAKDYAAQAETIVEDAKPYIESAKGYAEQAKDLAGKAKERHEAALAAATGDDGETDWTKYALELAGLGGLAGLLGFVRRKNGIIKVVSEHFDVSTGEQDKA